MWNRGEHMQSIDLFNDIALEHPGSPLPHFYLGAIHQFGTGDDSDNVVSEEYYLKALEKDKHHANSLGNLGKIYSDRAEREATLKGVRTHHGNLNFETSLRYYTAAISSSSQHLQSYINLGLLYHTFGLSSQSISTFNLALSRNLNSPDLHYNLAVSYQHQGSILESVHHYRLAIEGKLNSGEEYVEAWLNLAALHHKHGTVDDAIWHYERTERALLGEGTFRELPMAMHTGNREFFGGLARVDEVCELMLMILNNMGQALSQQGKVRESCMYHNSAVILLEERLELVRGGQEEGDVLDQIVGTRAHIFRGMKTSCSWELWRSFDELLADVKALQIAMGRQSSLLPFDTLGLPVSPRFRREIAVSHAGELSRFSSSVAPPEHKIADGRLKIGYICYDFNNHPTSHLAEGLFMWHNFTNIVDVDAYSYGKDDNSTYRRNIVDLVGGKEEDGGRFVELSHLGHDDSARLIKWHAPNILIDMQGFTLGGRPEITARRVAPIQVNYLIFPGTSGAEFMDYIIGDQWVTPPEHADHYTEKLALMPHSYQINYYDRHNPKPPPAPQSDEWNRIRETHNLPLDAFVFANFNKQDKLEPQIYSTWLNIMRRTPNSVLWLLEPSHKYADSGIVENLRLEAASRGISPSRILFANRVSKSEHLGRLGVADLFLDSFYYGAHSTATDALRGGLPVLTYAGNSFARRVGVSLIKNLSFGLDSFLLTSTAKELEDTAVSLAAGSRESLEIVRRSLKMTWGGKLFDTQLYTRDFERLMKLMVCVYEGGGAGMHVVL
ncbi:hypothetical protein TrVE_jg9158 [Triparma verrucosa]|uniref:protein O-GlcNAc transferase n=1 Tax=Triparma verrucosa TaxID=1606542 RepID=A0A9W7F2Z3_9STRA|nr:hypothetical protein TrVE_jg9158 [Triparma verrucosa]